MATIILGDGNNLSGSDDSSNDTIIVGNGNNDTVSAYSSQYDTITLGNGAGDTVNLTAHNSWTGTGGQYNTVTLGNGAGDTVNLLSDYCDTIHSATGRATTCRSIPTSSAMAARWTQSLSVMGPETAWTAASCATTQSLSAMGPATQ